MEIVVLLVLVVVVAATAGAVVVQRRRSGPELEPPADRPDSTVTLPPPAKPDDAAVEAPSDLDERTVAEIEEALAAARPETAEPVPDPEPEPESEPEPEVVAPFRPTFRERLGKARTLLAQYVGSGRSRTKIDGETWDDLEEALISADVGVGTSTEVLDAVRKRVEAESITDPEDLLEVLKAELKQRLAGERGLRYDAGVPNVWLFVGVNGVGKTTTIGKVGQREILAGRSVVMAAGDTFRAAAAEQLELWAKRVGADLVRGAEGGDPSSVIFDAVQRASARNADLVLADTAGRLHTKTNLMEELRKVRRIADRDPGRVTEVLLVLDATTGQNGLIQARQFTDAVEVTGVVLTKLDGSAKGGIVLAIQHELGIPVKLVGLGETADDLIEFDEEEFVEALFA
ncbi:signal recognition particle-docking protein FtsY [soil metagenome]